MGGSLTKNDLAILNEIVNEAISSVYNTSTNTVNSYVSNSIITEYQLINVHCRDVSIDNIITSNTNIVSNFTSQQATEIANKINTGIENKSAQIAQSIIGLFGGIGKYDAVQNSQIIQSRINNIILNTVSAQNLNTINAQTVNVINQKLVISDLVCESLRIGNTIIADQLVRNVVNNIATQIINDEIINRVVNDAKQTASLEQKGIDSIFTSLIIVAAIIAIVVIIGIIVIGATGAKALTNPTFWITMLVVVAVIIIGWLLLAYGFKFWPFKPAQTTFWGCEVSLEGGSAVNTGKCARKLNATDGPYPTQAACEKDAATGTGLCPQYWGCAKQANGLNITPAACARYSNVIYGVYPTERKCQDTAATRCGLVYKCAIDPVTGAFITDDSKATTCVPYNAGTVAGAAPERATCEEKRGTECLNNYLCLPSSSSDWKTCQLIVRGGERIPGAFNEKTCGGTCLPA